MAVIAESWREDGRLAKPGVVATVMSNLGLERYLSGLGLDLERTAVGDRYVIERMREKGCGFTYALQRLGHAHPALGPVRALLVRVPRGPRPWLRRLLSQLPGFVRRLRGYYAGV